MIAFINLFFVPMISVSIYYNQKKEQLKFDPAFVARYCIFTSLVFLGAKLLSQIVSIFYPINIQINTAFYTVFAVPVAVVISYLIAFFKAYFSVVIESGERHNEEKV